MEFRFGGVLFDCDGVLVDSLEAAGAAWDVWAERYAPQFDYRTQMRHGVRAADIVASFVVADRRAEAESFLEEAEIEGAAGTHGIAGAASLTAALPGGRWAVVTSGTSRLVRARLDAVGIARPEHIIAAEDVTYGKPDPEPYLLGAKGLGLEPSVCVVFEDAPAGVAAARAAGVAAVIGVGDHLEGAEVDARVDDLRQVRVAGDTLILQSR
ncbi:HAD-IA family hydrolase [Aeromicrobium sp. YIM 150415]|uniref:HAD-IA family hydrolase n=1 Tax=Aeromicrobium sp. YIM 150415 TaxID=2803912 RepID=UPI00196501EB|nr:HAD-IA family hydrolase [Aeromicrobium sp. YIM 150415]MBM9463999.1 HAD-IA family hydrolase [Aeromicrobium sp. YIM 150415]